MLKRLVDEDLHPGSPEWWLAELVRATPPLDAESLERQRLQARARYLERDRDPWRAPRRALAISGALLASLAAVASAAVIVGVVRRAPPAVPTVPSVVVRSPPAPLDTGVRLPVPAPSAGADEDPGTSNDPVAPSEAPRTVGPRSAALSSSARDSTGALASGEDPKLVLQAIRALRHSGNPAAAAALLGEYLRLHPQGALAEDALALSIEAAGARHDKAGAAALGRTYLARFPNGSSRELALRAVKAYTP